MGTKVKDDLYVSTKAELIETLKADPLIMDGIRRGIEACKSGKVRHWEDIKRDLKIA